MKNLAIFASGSGTNAENIINYFSNSQEIMVKLVLANREKAGVLERANRLQIPALFMPTNEIKAVDNLLELLRSHQIDYIILAGFMSLIPSELIRAFPNRILNIHPALLPNYGGKGMYGHHVHEAVIKNKETESGISIHYVNEQYDEGRIILQAHCPVFENDTAEHLANRIHKLEHRYYPQCIEQVICDHTN